MIGPAVACHTRARTSFVADQWGGCPPRGRDPCPVWLIPSDSHTWTTNPYLGFPLLLAVHNRTATVEGQASKEAGRDGAAASRTAMVSCRDESGSLGHSLLSGKQSRQVSTALRQWLATKRRQRGQQDQPLRKQLHPLQTMTEHTFTIRFLAPGRTLDDLSIDLYDRVDEASLMGPDEDGSFLYEFDRIAPTLPDALAVALSDLTSALPEATVLRVHE